MKDVASSLIDAAKFTPVSMNAPNAWVGHIPFASWLIKNINPVVFVELGTHSGNSYFSFCQAVCEARLSTKCYAVDTWQGEEHAGYYGEEIFNRVQNHNQQNFSQFSKLLRVSFDEALCRFSNGTINLLHIDGLHT